MENNTTLSTREGTDFASEINDKEIDEISKSSKQERATQELVEKIKKYIQIDDIIREKNEEIKSLRETRKPCEEYIMNYFEQNNELGELKIKTGKLIRNESEKKAPIKQEYVKEALEEKTKNEKLFADDNKFNLFVSSIIDLMEKKRPIKKTSTLKRTFNKDAKPKKIKPSK